MTLTSIKKGSGAAVKKMALALFATLSLGASSVCADTYHAGYDSQRERAREYRAYVFCRPAVGGVVLSSFTGGADPLEARTLSVCAR